MNATAELQADPNWAELLATSIAERSDPDCEEALIRRFRDPLVRMLGRMSGDPARAEDLAQETLLLILQKLRAGELKNPARLDAYVYSTGRFVFLGWCRRKENHVELREGMEQFVDAQEGIEDVLIEEERHKLVESLIGEMAMPRDREILQRHYLREQPKFEICDALVIDMDLYDRVISRARQRLRKRVEAEPAL